MAILLPVTVFTILAFISLTIWALQAAALCPLKHIPGPWYTKISNLPLKFATLGGKRIFFVDDLHKRYGPIVRLAPDEVDVADVATLKQIHALGSGFLKTQWYKRLLSFDHDNSFSIIDPKLHQARRKLFIRHYTRSSIKVQYEAMIKTHVELTVKTMKTQTAAHGGEIDMLKWWILMTGDISARMVFGKMDTGVATGETSPFLKRLTAFAIVGGISAELPWVRRIGAYIPYLRDFFNRAPLLARATEAMELMKSNDENLSVLSTPIKDGSLVGDDARCELIGHTVASVDTTANTLTYLIWAVLQRPELQQAVEAAASELPKDFTEQDVEDIPLLNGVCEESLRLYGSAPGGLPREVPQGGRTMLGYFIPEGLTVVTQSYTYHRLPELFPEPDRFEPNRWNAEAGMSADAKVAFHPFGIGPQICGGIALARMELRLAMATFFRECKGARLSASTTPASMEMENYFLIAPKSHHCFVMLNS